MSASNVFDYYVLAMASTTTRNLIFDSSISAARDDPGNVEPDVVAAAKSFRVASQSIDMQILQTPANSYDFCRFSEYLWG